MFNSTLLDTVIGLSFFYLVFSFLCLVITEIITRLLKNRHRLLQDALHKFFDNVKEGHLTPLLAESLRSVLGDFKKKKFQKRITKITPSQLADAVEMTLKKDIKTSLRPQKDASESSNYIDKLKKILGWVDLGDDPKTKKKNKKSDDLLDKLEAKLNERLGSILDTVNDLYSKYAQRLAMIIAFILVVFNNADSIKYAKKIYSDTTLRAALVASSVEISKQKSVDAPLFYDNLKKELDKNNELLLGIESWSDEPLFKKVNNKAIPESYNKEGDSADFWWWIQKIMGLLLTTALVSLGAPFWLDATKRLVGLKKKDEKQDSIQAKTGS